MKAESMPLVYLPDAEVLFLWSGGAPASSARELPDLERGGKTHAAVVVTPEGAREVDGRALPLHETMASLAVVPSAAIAALPASVATWTLASKLAIELVSRERIIPTLTHS